MDETVAVPGMPHGIYHETGQSLARVLVHPIDYPSERDGQGSHRPVANQYQPTEAAVLVARILAAYADTHRLADGERAAGCGCHSCNPFAHPL